MTWTRISNPRTGHFDNIVPGNEEARFEELLKLSKIKKKKRLRIFFRDRKRDCVTSLEAGKRKRRI